jgi:hypothetical protein
MWKSLVRAHSDFEKGLLVCCLAAGASALAMGAYQEHYRPMGRDASIEAPRGVELITFTDRDGLELTAVARPGQATVTTARP